MESDAAANQHRVTHGLSAAASQPRDSHSARVVMSSAHKARRPGGDFAEEANAAHDDDGRRKAGRKRQEVTADSTQRDDYPDDYHNWSRKQRRAYRSIHRRK